MKKEEKKRIVKDFVEIFSEPGNGIYLMDFKGLNVAEITELRSKLRAANVSMRVVKNTLARRAIKKAGIDSLDSYLVGPTGVVWSAEDSIMPARVLIDFLKKYDKKVCTIKAGLIDGSLMIDSDIEKISRLPNKQELYAKVASLLNGQIVKLAMTLNALPRKLARVVDALREKQE